MKLTTVYIPTEDLTDFEQPLIDSLEDFLVKTEGYFFTPEELKQVLSDAFEAGKQSLEGATGSEDVYVGGIGAKPDTKSCFCDNCFYGRTKLAEQLIQAKSETMFSLEDMRKTWDNGNNYHRGSLITASQFTFDKTIESLTKPIEYEFVPETEVVECETHRCDSYGIKTCNTCERQPKIVNNKIQGTWRPK